VSTRTVLVAALGALAVPAAGAAAVQQVLLPGPTPYLTPSPPLVTGAAPPWANLPFRIHASSVQRVVVGVDGSARPVSLRVMQRLLLKGTGDYQFVVSAPVEDVRAAAGSESQPGLRRGQILWSGFASRRKVLAVEADLRPGPARPFLPVRLRAQRTDGGYALTLTNATPTSQATYTGRGFRAGLARLLDRTRREALSGRRLSPTYVALRGLVRVSGRVRVAAPIRVTGTLRFPQAPTAARGGTLHGRTVSVSTVLGDERPLTQTVEVDGGGGAPGVRLVASPTAVVRGLAPPRGRSWAEAVRRRPLSSDALLRRLLVTRLELVRSDQYGAFLANPDVAGANRTVYVYETAARPVRASAVPSRSGSGTSALVVLLAAGGAVLATAVALVGWAHS
jgi:hypothetical protein